MIEDVFELAPGDQIVVDGEVLSSDGLAVDESLLTGESDAIDKVEGDGVKSGSFVTSGGGVARATAVGDDSYAARLTAEAKQFHAPEVRAAKGIDSILGFVTWAIIPAALLSTSASGRATTRPCTRRSSAPCAGVVALVPQGLVLLLSMAQTVAVIRLGRKQVLVQRLQAVESLARVTVLASDKTGTLTTGAIMLEKVEPLSDAGRGGDGRVETALAAVAAADQFPTRR